MFGKRLMLILGLAIVAALAGPASAQSPPPPTPPPGFGCAAPGSNSNVNFTFHQPISQVLTNFCTNPATTVTLVGEVFFEYDYDTNANDDVHEHSTSNYYVTGTDSNVVNNVGKDQQ